MRLALKLTVAVSLAVAIGLVVQALIHHRRIVMLHEEEAKDDMANLAVAMREAVTEIWTSTGEDAAVRYVAQANERRAGIRIHLARLDRHSDLAEAEASDRAGEVEATVPISIDGVQVAALSVGRSVESEEEFRDELIATQLITTSGLVLAVAIVALLLGRRFVAQPTSHLISQVRRIGAGDYEPAPEVSQRDEIGALARAINDASKRLDEARAVARSQRRARAEALEQLRHADRLSTVGKLASGIAHELGTPLNVVQGRASMIAANAAAPDEVKNDAAIIAERAEHMAAIIRQLLTFARRGVQTARTSVRELLEHAVTLMEALAEKNDVVIEVPHADVDHFAVVDEGKVLQVLTNLMVNAVQAMPDGGRLTLSATSEDIDKPPEERAAPGRFVKLTVKDEGVGIPVDQLEHIFDPFFTTKSAREGTGLGLSVCHGIVREHGGWIDVDSTPGAGTTFAVYLPEGASE